MGNKDNSNCDTLHAICVYVCRHVRTILLLCTCVCIREQSVPALTRSLLMHISLTVRGHICCVAASMVSCTSVMKNTKYKTLGC